MVHPSKLEHEGAAKSYYHRDKGSPDLEARALNESFHLAVHRGMARAAQRDQVCFRIITGSTAKVSVVNFQVRHRAA